MNERGVGSSYLARLMAMACTSHTLFFNPFHLLLLLIFIHGAQTCPPSISFDCPDHAYNGKLLEYPFTSVDIPGCGYCTLNCSNNVTMIACEVDPVVESLQVLSISTANQTMVLRSPKDDEWRKNPCRAQDFFSIKSSPWVSLIMGFTTFIRCPTNMTQGSLSSGQDYGYNCKVQDNTTVYGLYGEDPPNISSPKDCEVVQFPSIPLNTSTFIVRYNFSDQCQQCVQAGGRCSNSYPGTCYRNNGKKRLGIILGPGKMRLFGAIIAASFFGTLVLISVVLFRMRRELRDKFTWDDKSFETFLENYGSVASKRYTYTDIKKITNSFKEKLGEGGYGGVYKGKLPDGRLVAVKLLKHAKGNGEDFINEVASISRTNHVNVVTLLGFCCAGRKRALVYEFMANGSLEKFTNDGANCDQSLPLETLFRIALGIARGLEYLHQGCKTRILHFDIKPHNILLDEEFCPKISDFGLAKVSQQTKQSKVSMSGTRGTIGYISPEMFCRNFGDVSHKSDVYSYGMMVLEMIGSRKGQDAKAGCSSELIFPQWIYEQLEHGDDAEVDGITQYLNNEEKGLKRKMIIVSLWCIQTVPSCRPSMSNVLRMLEGSLELIQIPPMPSLSSPPRTQFDPSGSSIQTVSL